MRLILPISLVMFAGLTAPAHAYVGPGLGLGVLGVVFGLILALVMAVFSFVWMPLKRRVTGGKRPPKAKEPGNLDAS